METLGNDRLMARLLGELSERDESGAMDDTVSVGQQTPVETGQSTQDLVLLQDRQTNIQSQIGNNDKFFFRIIPSMVAAADFPSPFEPIFCIFLCHFYHGNVLPHGIHKPPFRPSLFLFPGSSILTTLLPIYPSSFLRTCPNHLSLPLVFSLQTVPPVLSL